MKKFDSDNDIVLPNFDNENKTEEVTEESTEQVTEQLTEEPTESVTNQKNLKYTLDNQILYDELKNKSVAGLLLKDLDPREVKFGFNNNSIGSSSKYIERFTINYQSKIINIIIISLICILIYLSRI